LAQPYKISIDNVGFALHLMQVGRLDRYVWISQAIENVYTYCVTFE